MVGSAMLAKVIGTCINIGEIRQLQSEPFGLQCHRIELSPYS